MKSFATILLLFVLPSVYAQMGGSTMFWNNYTSFNPAAAGLHKHQAAIGYRYNQAYQQTLTANYSANVKSLHGGIGLNYMLEEQSFSKRNKVDLNYSYQMRIGHSILSAGVSAGIMHIDDREIYGSITGANILPKSANQTAFTTNAGIIFTNRNLIAGISSTLLNAPRFDDVFSKPNRTYHVSAGYVFRISENFKLKPQALFSTDDQGFSTLDLNLLAYYKNKFWAGSTLRGRDAFSFMAGFDFRQKFRVGYSYDFTTSKLNNSVMGATHEFTLGLFIPKRSCKPFLNSYTF